MKTDVIGDKDKKKDVEEVNNEPQKQVGTNEQQKIFIDMIKKSFEPYAKAIEAIGKKVDEHDMIMKDVVVKLGKLDPIIDQISNPQAQAQGQGAPAQMPSGNPQADATVLNTVLGALQSFAPKSDGSLPQFFASMGAKYFEAMVEQSTLINKIISQKLLGDTIKGQMGQLEGGML